MSPFFKGSRDHAEGKTGILNELMTSLLNRHGYWKETDLGSNTDNYNSLAELSCGLNETVCVAH